MFFVLVYVCSISLTTHCIPVQEPLVPGYTSQEKCEQHTRQLIESIKIAETLDDPYHAHWPKRPWHLKGYCITPIIDETFLG